MGVGDEQTLEVRPSVWVVDDEPELLDSMDLLLSDSGYESRGFLDPRQVLETLSEEYPDLFIVDLSMPHIPGVELIRALRGRDDTSNIPVIVLTAMSSEGSMLNAFEAGADDVVRKPFTFSEMLVRMRLHLQRKDRFSELHQQTDDLRLMTSISRALNRGDDLSSMLQVVVDGVREAIDVARCAIYLVDRKSGDLHRALPTHPSRSEGSPNVALDLRDLPQVADALAARRAVFLDADETMLLVEAMGGNAPDLGSRRSAAVYPIVHSGVFIGAIVLAAGRHDLGQTHRDRMITSIVCDLSAIAIHRSELYRSVVHESYRVDETNRELARTRDFLSNVIQSSPDAIVASNRSGEIVLFNRAAEQILGHRAIDAIGKDVRILYPEGRAEKIMQMLRSGEHGGAGRLLQKREIVIDANGNEIPVDISAAIVFEEDEEAATVGIFTDIRGRLQMEEQLQEAAENLERSRRQAVIVELAGAAAHELNQPLTSLLGYAELLRRRTEPNDENFKAIETISEEAKRIAQIIRKIGKIADYKTKEYVGGARIVDLDMSSEVEDDEEIEEQGVIRDGEASLLMKSEAEDT